MVHKDRSFWRAQRNAMASIYEVVKMHQNGAKRNQTPWVSGFYAAGGPSLLIGYLIANLKLNLRGEKEPKIHVPSW